MSESDKPSFYAIIPATVRYSDICPNAKLLYGEITALCNKYGYCWASNKYFADLYKKDKHTISRWITNLNEKGFIDIYVKKHDSGVYERKITINEKVQTPTQKDQGGMDKKVQGYGQKDVYSITPNNTINNKPSNTHVHESYKKEWNEIAKEFHLPKLAILTKSRIQKIDVRIKDDPLFGGHFNLCLEKIKHSRYLRGEVNGWRVSFDWLFINDKNYIKVCEGNYDDRKGKDKAETILEKYRGK